MLNARAVMLTNVVPVTFVGRTLGHGSAGVHGGIGPRQAQWNGHMPGLETYRTHTAHKSGVQG